MMFCVPSFVVIWRNIRSLVDQAVASVLVRRLSAKRWRTGAIQVILRDSIVIILTIFVGMWFIPFVVGLFHIGSLAIVMPILLLVLFVYLIVRSVYDINKQLERTFRRTLLGEEYISTSETASLLGVRQDTVAKLARKMKLPAIKIHHRWYVDRAKAEKLKRSASQLEEHSEDAEGVDSDSTEGELGEGKIN